MQNTQSAAEMSRCVTILIMPGPKAMHKMPFCCDKTGIKYIGRRVKAA